MSTFYSPVNPDHVAMSGSAQRDQQQLYPNIYLAQICVCVGSDVFLSTNGEQHLPFIFTNALILDPTSWSFFLLNSTIKHLKHWCA